MRRRSSPRTSWRSRRSRSAPCPAPAARWRSAPTSGRLQQVVFAAPRWRIVVGLEGIFGAAAFRGDRRKDMFVAAGFRRVAHRRRRGALLGLLVPPDGAALLLRLDLFRMLREKLAHEFRQVGLVHYLCSSGSHLRSSAPT